MNRTPLLYLASNSPRRASLLRQVGFSFQIAASNIAEIPHDRETVKETVLRFAREKALATAEKILLNGEKNAVILAADTDGEFEGKILGKPKNQDDALEMLKKMAGKEHLIHSAFAICEICNGKIAEIAAQLITASVRMIDFEEDLFRQYVESGECLDKAGSYALQGRGAVLVAEMQGDFYSVVGLPLFAVCQELRRLGIKPNFDMAKI
ncbi:MAG: septum formation protein Maf [Cardiobacteriaceae bacterium]|nr:septum formation protein Maf [Cardiobacteriaceae bacterium]